MTPGLGERSVAKNQLLALLRERAYRKGTFTLASGRQSDFFIDCKQVVLLAQGHYLVGQAVFHELHDHLHHRGIAAVAGVALGGCPIASAVSFYSAGVPGHELDALYVRKSAKDHGTKRLIEGPNTPAEPLSPTVVLDARKSVALVEDVVTTGGSSLQAVDTLRAHGYEVPLIVALVDREEGGAQTIRDAGIELRALFKRSDFVK